MAVEGIRTPIVIDLSDIPKSVAAVEKEIQRLKKRVGDVDIKLEGRYLDDLSKKSLKPLIKQFETLTNKAKNAKARFAELAKVMKTVRAGAEISDKKQQQVGAMPGVGEATRRAMTRYTIAQGTAAQFPGDVGAQKEMMAAQKKFITLLKQAQGVQQKTINQTKQFMELEVKRATKTNRFRQEEINKNKQIYEQFRRLYVLHRQGKTTKEEQIQLGRTLNQMRMRGIQLTRIQAQTVKGLEKQYLKLQKTQGGLLNWGRAGWFLQLRLFWEVFRVLTAIVGEMVELDDATARAMRTMVRDTKDYEATVIRVRKAITETARVTGASYKDVGEGLYQLSSAGLTATESIAALNSVVKLSIITESNMTDTTKVVAGAYNNFRDSIQGAQNDTEKFMKISSTMTYVWKRNQIDMNELVQGMNQSAQSAKLAGLKFEELGVILGNMGTRMIRSGRAGRMLRSAVINIAQKSAKVKEAFDITFDPTKPMDFMGIMDKMHAKWKQSNKSAMTTAAIFDIFGKRGAPALISMLDSWEKIRSEVDGLGSAMDMAIDQHKTLLKQQEHFKALGKTIWKEWMAALTEYVDIVQVARGILKNFRDDLMSTRAAKENTKSMEELRAKYTDSGAVTERLVQLQAELQLRLEAGMDISEPLIKSYGSLIAKLKEIKRERDAEVAAVEAENEAKKQATIATLDMSVGYSKADEKLRSMAIAAGMVKVTTKELADRMKTAATEIAEAREEYALFAAMADKDIGTIPPDVTSRLKAAQAAYNKLKQQYDKLMNEMQAAAMDKNMAGFGAEGDATYQKYKGEERAGEAARRRADWARMNAEWTMAELEHKQELKDIDTALDEKFEARNLSAKEKEDREREREFEKLDNMDAMIEKELELNLIQQNAEEQALMDATTPEQEDTALARLNELQNAEAQLQQQKEINDQKRLSAAETYNSYQKKRIQGIYAERGAIAAASEMWKAYGDQIGTYASSMVDQWKDMFMQMGKESKTAWKVYQAIAIAQAIVDTFKTAQAGASALAGIPFVGPALAAAWIATSIATGMMRVQQIRSQKPQSAATGGVFEGGLAVDAYASGGVTSGVAMGIVGDNPSGKELVIPSENINRNEVSGYVRESEDKASDITIANVVTNEDIAAAMSDTSGQHVIVNTIGQDMRERRSTYRSVKETQRRN